MTGLERKNLTLYVVGLERASLTPYLVCSRMRDLQPPASKKDGPEEGPKAVAAVVAEW